MAYADAERRRNTLSGALSLAGTGAGIGTAIAPGVGTAVGAGIGLLAGGISGYFLTDDEKNEMIEMYREGRLDDETLANIESTIARRYDMLQRQQGADLSRRGLSKSTFAQRQVADTYNAERESLAQAVTNESGRRQQIGFAMSDAAGAQRAQDVASGVGAAFQGWQLYQEGEAMKADTASNDRMIAAIGQIFQDGGGSESPSKGPAVAFSQTGAGNAFARHRSRMPSIKSPFVPEGATLDKLFGRMRGR